MKNIIRKNLVLWTLCLSIAALASITYSHCQIPCGIYNDQTRFDIIAENIATIEKSMKLITELSNEEKPNLNQIVRWVENKENHADDISHIVTYYFLAQRIKPADKAAAEEYSQYVKKLTLLHEILIYSMKAKQSTDLANVEKLKTLLADFQNAYSAKTTHEH
jgi:nickel superoxide dismutase